MLADLSLHTLALVWLGGFLGGMAAGAAGFALGIVANTMWLHAISPVHAAVLVVGTGLVNQAGLNWSLRKSIDMRLLWPFLAGGLVGVPIGVALLVQAPADIIRLAVAIVMIAYGLYALIAPRLPPIVWGGRLADGTVGFLGGVLGGLGGLSGVLPAIWTQLRGWPKETARSVYQPYILAAHCLSLLLIGFVALDRTGVMLFLLALPSVLIGSWIGWMIYGKLSERQFQQMFAALLIVSGLLLGLAAALR